MSNDSSNILDKALAELMEMDLDEDTSVERFAVPDTLQTQDILSSTDEPSSNAASPPPPPTPTPTPPPTPHRSASKPPTPHRSASKPPTPHRSASKPPTPHRSASKPPTPHRSASKPSSTHTVPRTSPAPRTSPSAPRLPLPASPAPAGYATPAPSATPRRALDPQTYLTEDAAAIVKTCKAELEKRPLAPRAARLHCDIAQVHEDVLRDSAAATRHYDKALLMAPDYLPAIRGARRVCLNTGDYKRALPLYEAEVRLTPEPEAKAMLHYERARLLESFLERSVDARRAYMTALSLDPTNMSILKAMERLAVHATEWEELSRAYERAANAVAGDPRLRAALTVKRARLAEERFDDPGAVIDLCEAALRLDPHALGAARTLRRLYRERGDWGALVTVLERQAQHTTDPRVRANALHEIGRLHAERLNNRVEALGALIRAAEATEHRDRLILDDLAHLYAASGDHQSLIHVLEALYAVSRTAGERVALLHRMGHLYERYLSNDDEAIRCHNAALSLDPTHVPTLQALATLHTRRAEWSELVHIHLTEAQAETSVKRRALAHGRVAVLYEIQLGRPDEAAEHHARALSLDPGAEASFKALTRLYAAAGKYRELVEVYEAGLDRTADATRRLTYLFKIGGLWEEWLNEPVQAIYAYQRVLDIEPSNLSAIHALQRACERAGRYRELQQALELEIACTDDDTVKVALMHRVGQVLEEHLGDREAALACFKDVLSLSPRYQPVLSSLGRLYYRAGRWPDLLGVYEQELVSKGAGGDAVVLLHKMGELCEQKLGRPDDAIAFYRRSASMDPTYQPALRALQRLLRERGAWANLVTALEVELKHTSEPYAQTLVLYSIGQIQQEHLDQGDAAADAYERALQHTPDYWPARVALTRLHDKRAAWDSLVEDLELERRGTSDVMTASAALLRRGEVARDRLQDPDRAIECFESLLDSEPGKLPALLALESLYEQVGAWDALASVYLEQANTVVDDSARVASLRELARVQQVKGVGELVDLAATYEAILSLSPNDHMALTDMHRLVRSSGDDSVLPDVFQRLADTTDDPALSARYYTSVGYGLERADSPDAIEAYRKALSLDSECIGAIRGLARTAEYQGDHRGLADAARMEAAFVRDRETSAKLLVRSASLRLDHVGDSQGAVQDLERALEAWPDDLRAAQRLREPLLSSGQASHLASVLSRAAGSATNPRCAAHHWLDVAGLYFDHLGQMEHGFNALHRALRAVPDHLPAMQRLAGAYLADRRAKDAIGIYERLVTLSSDDAVVCDAYIRLATIWGDTYNELRRAYDCLTSVLEIDPSNRYALTRMADLQLRNGDPLAAAETAQHMVAAAADDDARVAALIYLGRIEQGRHELDSAEHALTEALALQGPDGEAASVFQQLIQTSGSWVGYASALSTFIQRGADRDTLKRTYLELASIQADHLDRPEQAVASLEAALTALQGDSDIASVLALRLCAAGRPEQALERLRDLLHDDPTQADLWRGVVAALEETKRPRSAINALGPLVLLDAATRAERSKWSARVARPAKSEPGSFGEEVLRRVGKGDALTCSATELLRTLSGTMTRLYKPDLDSIGLSKRDRLSARSQHPTRMLGDRVAEMLGIEYELYLHPRSSPLVSLEMTEPISIVLAERAADLSDVEQAFLLASMMVPAAGRYVALAKLSTGKLSYLLAAAGRIVSSSFADDLDTEELSLHTNRIKKALPRRARRAFEAAATAYVADGDTDIASWKAALEQTSRRAAMLIADDLLCAVEMTRELEDLSGESPALIRTSPSVADLVEFWISDDADAVRRSLGLLTR